MFHEIEKSIQNEFHAHIAARYGIDLPVAIEQPKQSGFGELAIPVAFQLAKQLKQAPRKIAGELIEEIGPLRGVASLEIAGNGYINLRLDRAAYAWALLTGNTGSATATTGKIVVEHTNINPNKAAHIGHLRNAVLGDSFIRMLRASGQQVEVQNYIDNTGVQVADVVVGFHFLEGKNTDEVTALIADSSQRFDYVCWDLYARTSQYYKDHPESLAWRSETLHAIESGTGDLSHMAFLVADAIVQLHLKTMLRLGIEYDVLPRESEILHLQFWASAFELLKKVRSHLPGNGGQERRLLGHAAFRVLVRSGIGRQQSDCPFQRHCDLCRKRHCLSALEIRTAGQRLFLSTSADLSRWS